KFGLKVLEKKGVKIVSLNELRIKIKPIENGKTFRENSEIKARFYGGLTKLSTVADDGGLIIPYLNNEPGVKSNRWLGREATDEELIQHTLLHLKSATHADRTAYLQTCVCFYLPVIHPQGVRSATLRVENPKTHPADGMIICEEEKIKGHIAEKPSPRRIEGYPYRALFIVEKYNKYYDELTEAEHLKVNHRLKALKRLVQRIIKFI
ncbi:non-canonical purine NTP pyrophosphatase, partial [Candidatus Roizmanbacteria bacterium]|nr:non-canonical purine NTP pyrophosphatase [Candidatus Roizmanbacteria bacterium]